MKIIFIFCLISLNFYLSYSQRYLDTNDVEYYPIATTQSNTEPDVVWSKIYKRMKDSKDIKKGNSFLLKNPIDHFTVVPPPKGCGSGYSLPSETAKVNNCIYATNGGFFNQETSACLGNLISDGVIKQSENVNNVNFGITKSNKFIVGYIMDFPSIEDEIVQLITGIGWLVRNGKNNVRESLMRDDLTVQNTGSTFITALSARSAIGHNSKGELLIVTIDGKTWDHGVNFELFANLLVEMDVVNAINIDGGGSAVALVNGAIVSIPSDSCANTTMFACERPVTSITCIHASKSEAKLSPKHEISSLQTFAIVLAALVVLSCSVNFGACLIFLQSRGIISCDIFSWLLDKQNISNTSDNTNLPLDIDLVIDNTDSRSLLSDYKFKPNFEMKSYLDNVDDF